MRQWRSNLISCATLYFAHPCAETAHLCSQFFVQGLHCIFEALKIAVHFIQELIAFCLLLNTAAFSCKHVHRLYISVFEKRAYVVWANDDFPPSAPPPFFLSLKVFFFHCRKLLASSTFLISFRAKCRHATGPTDAPLVFKATFKQPACCVAKNICVCGPFSNFFSYTLLKMQQKKSVTRQHHIGWPWHCYLCR